MKSKILFISAISAALLNCNPCKADMVYDDFSLNDYRLVQNMIACTAFGLLTSEYMVKAKMPVPQLFGFLMTFGFAVTETFMLSNYQSRTQLQTQFIGAAAGSLLSVTLHF